MLAAWSKHLHTFNSKLIHHYAKLVNRSLFLTLLGQCRLCTVLGASSESSAAWRH